MCCKSILMIFVWVYPGFIFIVCYLQREGKNFLKIETKKKSIVYLFACLPFHIYLRYYDTNLINFIFPDGSLSVHVYSKRWVVGFTDLLWRKIVSKCKIYRIIWVSTQPYHISYVRFCIHLDRNKFNFGLATTEKSCPFKSIPTND